MNLLKVKLATEFEDDYLFSTLMTYQLNYNERDASNVFLVKLIDYKAPINYFEKSYQPVMIKMNTKCTSNPIISK